MSETMSTKEFAREYEINIHYARTLLREGKVPARKNETGAYIVERADAEAWNDTRSGRGGGRFVVDEEGWVSMKRAAELAGISTVYCRKCVISGKIEGEKRADGHWYVKEESAREFERSRDLSDGLLYVLKLTEEELEELEELGYELRRKNQ